MHLGKCPFAEMILRTHSTMWHIGLFSPDHRAMHELCISLLWAPCPRTRDDVGMLSSYCQDDRSLAPAWPRYGGRPRPRRSAPRETVSGNRSMPSQRHREAMELLAGSADGGARPSVRRSNNSTPSSSSSVRICADTATGSTEPARPPGRCSRNACRLAECPERSQPIPSVAEMLSVSHDGVAVYLRMPGAA